MVGMGAEVGAGSGGAAGADADGGLGYVGCKWEITRPLLGTGFLLGMTGPASS